MRQVSAAFALLPLAVAVLIASGCASEHDSLYRPVDQSRSTSIDADRQMLDNEPVMEEATRADEDRTNVDRDDEPPVPVTPDDDGDLPGPDAG